MRGSIRLFRVFGISINIHVTFILLVFFFMTGGLKWLFVLVGIFFFVTLHELCHSLVAMRFGIKVREITLLPIGGVASMAKMPDKPAQEFLISLAGPMFNIMVVAVFFLPLRRLLGDEVLFHQPSTATWPLAIAYVYWINLMLAAFNLLPAFPMDGGRMLRALLAAKLGIRRATRIAVNLGHLFALLFAYLGIARFNIMLVIIAVFIYTAASGEEMQVDIKETLKKFRVRDILPHNLVSVRSDATLGKVLEIIFHYRQEDFPVVDDGKLVGFVTRQDLIAGLHQFGKEKIVLDVMRREFPKVKDTDTLVRAQNLMQANGITAMPVLKDGDVIGVITMEDINRAYVMISRKG